MNDPIKIPAEPSAPALSVVADSDLSLRVVYGRRLPERICAVCTKPFCNTTQHGKWACSDECCEVIIRGENKKVRDGLSRQEIIDEAPYLDPADPADNITLNNFFL